MIELWLAPNINKRIIQVMSNIVLGDDPSCGIKKRVLHASRKNFEEYPDGTRV